MVIGFQKLVALFSGMFLLVGAVIILPPLTAAASDTALKEQQDRQNELDKYKKSQI